MWRINKITGWVFPTHLFLHHHAFWGACCCCCSHLHWDGRSDVLCVPGTFASWPPPFFFKYLFIVNLISLKGEICTSIYLHRSCWAQFADQCLMINLWPALLRIMQNAAPQGTLGGSVQGSGWGGDPGWEAPMGQPISPTAHAGDSSAWNLALGSQMIKIFMNPIAEAEQVKYYLRKAIRTGLSAGKHNLSSHVQAFFQTWNSTLAKNMLVPHMGAVREQSGCGDPLPAGTQLPGFLWKI